MPRIERMTETKWRQVLSSRGAELDLVRCFEVLGHAHGFVCLPLQRMGSTHLDVCIGYVSHHIVLTVNHSQGGNALAIHQLQGFFQGFVAAASPARQHLPIHTEDPKRRT